MMLTKEHKADVIRKCEYLRKAMGEIGADACLLSMDVNLYYMTGTVYNGYFYLPLVGQPVLFVKKAAGSMEEVTAEIRKPEQMPEYLLASGQPLPEKLLLEADELSYNEYVRLQHIFNPKETANATALLRKLRMIKTDWEIGQLRISAAAHAAVYAEVPECYHSGMTDLELQYEIESRMRKHGSLGVFKAFGPNMDIFMGSLLAGENAEAPSPFDFALGGRGAHPFSPLGATGIKLQRGMSVMLDMSGNYTAYMTDMTRTFSVGKLSEEAYRAHQVSRNIHAEIMNYAKPGICCADLYNLAMTIVEKEGLAHCFMGTVQQAKFIGHGVGLQINELPVLTPRSTEQLQTGMVLALEPKFVISGVGAVGVENTLLVTADGIENLTPFQEEIISLED